MSVLIKDIKMPISCIECPCSLNLFFCKVYGGKPVTDSSSLTINGTTINVKRPDWCPLVEIPEHHGRLIDADALVPDICHDWNGYRVPNDDYSWECIHNAPTIIEAEGADE